MLRQSDQNIPAPLRWTIERCLAKDPAERYESSRDLFQGLRSLRDHASEGSACVGRGARRYGHPTIVQRRADRSSRPFWLAFHPA